jgi:hypothetical protein
MWLKVLSMSTQDEHNGISENKKEAGSICNNPM